MIMGISKELFNEMVHWLWLWMLAAIAISVLQLHATGQQTLPALRLGPAPIESMEGSRSIPIPNIDRSDSGLAPRFDLPNSFRGRYGITETNNATLGDVLLLNDRGDYKRVIKIWQQIDITPECVTWKHVGIGAAHLRLESLDQAFEQLTKALKVDPGNAVAEYLLGRVYQAKSRQTPFWYEKDDKSSFRLVAFHPNYTANDAHEGLDRGDAFLPHFKTLPFDKQAKQHFRLAIRLFPVCNIDRPIDFVQPRIRLASQSSEGRPVTVRDLLISLDEENYVEKARLEVGERLVSDNGIAVKRGAEY